MYRVGLDTVRSSNFCAVCRGCVFYNKLTATVVYFVFGQLLIRLESILSIYNAFVRLFDTDRLVRVNLFFCFVPKQKLCIKFVPLKVADVHIASQFPKFLLLVIISCIGFDAGIDVKQRIKFLQIDSFFKSPIRWVLFIVYFPLFGNNFVACDARIGY